MKMNFQNRFLSVLTAFFLVATLFAWTAPNIPAVYAEDSASGIESISAPEYPATENDAAKDETSTAGAVSAPAYYGGVACEFELYGRRKGRFARAPPPKRLTARPRPPIRSQSDRASTS